MRESKFLKAGLAGCLLSLALVMSLTASASEKGPSEQASPEKELSEKLQGAETLQGNFVQRLYDQDGNLLQESEGLFAIQRPGSFYWETRPPYEQIVVSNADTLWVYDPDLAQVTVRRQTQSDQVSPAELLSGSLRDLDAHYQVSSAAHEGGTRYTLLPLDTDAIFAKLILDYQGQDLVGLQFEDNLGQRTELSFTDVEMNAELDSELFQFDIPSGVDVIVDE